MPKTPRAPAPGERRLRPRRCPSSKRRSDRSPGRTRSPARKKMPQAPAVGDKRSTMPASLTVATRKSALALAQCRAWIKELRRVHPGLSVTEHHVTTSGDRIVDRPLADIGGKGLFVKEIEEAILAGTADIAVHSLKDVPPELMPQLTLSCFPQRADPRDVMVSRTGCSFEGLPPGARVGTSSLRRQVQLRALRPD